MQLGCLVEAFLVRQVGRLSVSEVAQCLLAMVVKLTPGEKCRARLNNRQRRMYKLVAFHQSLNRVGDHLLAYALVQPTS